MRAFPTVAQSTATHAVALALPLLAVACADGTGPPGPRRVGEWDTYGRVRDRWYVRQPGFGAACPVIAGPLAVFGTGDGQLIGRDRGTGAARWQAVVNTARSPVVAPLLAVRGVVVALADYYTVGVDQGTGRVRWAYAAPTDSGGPFDYPPAPGFLAENAAAADSAGTVYVPAWGGSVSAVDVRTGEARWVWRFDRNAPYGSGGTGTAVAGDTVFAAFYENANRTGTERRGWLVSFDGASGRELARVALPFAPTSIGGRIIAAPTVVVVTSGGGGQLAAIDRRTGTIAWWFNPPASRWGMRYASSPGVGGDADVVFQDGGNDRFYAVRAATGERLWENDFFGSPVGGGAPTASTRRVYASNGWALTVYDRAGGSVVAKVVQPGRDPMNGDGGLVGCVAVAGREVYATVDGGAWSFREP
jgi:outer membrane protein assembly factor BamB